MSRKDDWLEREDRLTLNCYDESFIIAKKIGEILKKHEPSLMTVAFTILRLEVGMQKKSSEWPACRERAFEFAHDNFEVLIEIDKDRNTHND